MGIDIPKKTLAIIAGFVLLLLAVTIFLPRVWSSDQIPTPTPTYTPRPWWDKSRGGQPGTIRVVTATPAPAGQYRVRVTAEALNVRAGPGTSYERLTVVYRGDELAVQEQNTDGSWLHIRTRTGVTGWVSAAFVAPVNGGAVAPAATPTVVAARPTPAATAIPVSSPAAPPTTAPWWATPATTTAPQARPTPQPTPQPAQAPVAGVPSPSYGLSAELHLRHTERMWALDRVEELGFRWIRVFVPWRECEPTRNGEYNWGWLDEIVNDAAGRGFELLFTVTAAPEWARPADDDKSVNGWPENVQDYADFAGVLAARYRGRVAAYEVWNEQNLAREVGGEGRMNAAGYVQLLRGAYRAIKSADPQAVVVSGGLTPTGTDDGWTAIDDRRYLGQMYDAGLKEVSDAIGVHPSGYNLPPTAHWKDFRDCGRFTAPCTNPHPSWSFQATIADYRGLMNANGDGDKQLWATEFGWASCGKAQPWYEYCLDNTPEEQADYLFRAFELVKQHPEWGLGVMFVWNLNMGMWTDPDGEMAAFSIIGPGGGLRPAFDKLKWMEKK